MFHTCPGRFKSSLHCRKRPSDRFPEAERHPHGLQRLHHRQQGVQRSSSCSHQAASFLHFGFSTFSQMMQTNADGVFAGGDAVTFPFPPRNNKKVNIPHWQMAHVHGGCVTAGPSHHAQDLSWRNCCFFCPQDGWPPSAWWAELLTSKQCLSSGRPCLGRPFATQVGGSSEAGSKGFFKCTTPPSNSKRWKTTHWALGCSWPCLFVKVMVMALMTSSYKETWTSWNL